MSLSPRFNRRLEDLARECEWVVEHGSEGMEGEAAERLVHAERLERIGREAESLKTEGDSLIRSELAGLGLSVHEIEQKTEETARLWRAA